MEKLPGTEALEVPGRAEGERRIVRNGNRAEVYMWDSAQSQWTKFGEVVDAASAPAKSIAHGREYDYVFDVDLGDGHPPRKLGYNANGLLLSSAMCCPASFFFFFGSHCWMIRCRESMGSCAGVSMA